MPGEPLALLAPARRMAVSACSTPDSLTRSTQATIRATKCVAEGEGLIHQRAIMFLGHSTA